MKERTTIAISKELKTKLFTFGKMGDTPETVINGLITKIQTQDQEIKELKNQVKQTKQTKHNKQSKHNIQSK